MRDKKNKKTFMLRTGAAAFFTVVLPLVFFEEVQAAGSAGGPALSETGITLDRGITGKLTVKNKQAGAKVLWSSKNKKIAKVKRGDRNRNKTGKDGDYLQSGL